MTPRRCIRIRAGICTFWSKILLIGLKSLAGSLNGYGPITADRKSPAPIEPKELQPPHEAKRVKQLTYVCDARYGDQRIKVRVKNLYRTPDSTNAINSPMRAKRQLCRMLLKPTRYMFSVVTPETAFPASASRLSACSKQVEVDDAATGLVWIGRSLNNFARFCTRMLSMG